MDVTLYPSDETILKQLSDQGINVDCQCLKGYCGMCRTQLIDGAVEYIGEPIAAISDKEILPCCSKPLTKVELCVPG